MSKKSTHKHELMPLLESSLASGEEKKLVDYLTLHSNLPGKRGNLELAQVFAEAILEYAEKHAQTLWELLLRLIDAFPERKAPTNSPEEFVSFCATWGLGALGSTSETYAQQSLLRLKELASDPRWRMREAIAFGIQELARTRIQETLDDLQIWIVDEQWLPMRGVAAGVAEPKLLVEKMAAKKALELHKRILEQVMASKDRKSEEFRVLRKGLGYTLSVVVSAIPGEGFSYMEQLAKTRDKDVLWILKENLKKNRLVRNYPTEVNIIGKLMNRSPSQGSHS